MDMCISELQSFNLSKSLISSQLLSELSASDIKVWVKPDSVYNTFIGDSS